MADPNYAPDRGLQYLQHRLLDEPISHGRDAEQAHPAARFRNFDALHRVRLVTPRPCAAQIHCLDRALDEPNPAEHATDRAHGMSRLHEGGRDLREQRGKEKEIAAADEGDVDLESPSESEIQGHRGIHPAEAAADDDDVGARKRVHWGELLAVSVSVSDDQTSPLRTCGRAAGLVCVISFSPRSHATRLSPSRNAGIE